MKEIESLKRVFVAINQNKISDTLQYFSPDIVRVEPEGFPTAGTYRGHDEILKHITHGRGTWAEGTCSPEGFVVAGDKVVVLLYVNVRVKDRTEWIKARFSDVFRFRDGKVVEWRSFGDTHAALIWAGAAVRG